MALHGPIKAQYRENEMKCMLDLCQKKPNEIAAPSRDDMMEMCVNAFLAAHAKIDNELVFKQCFVTNDLNGKEDHLVSGRLFDLIGPEMQEIRKKLMDEKTPKTLDELMKTITPPKGIRRNTEGTELFDCTGDEIEPKPSDNFMDYSSDEDSEGDENPNITEKQVRPVLPNPKIRAPILANICNDSDINEDAVFLDELQKLLDTHQTSKLFIPFKSGLRVLNVKSRKSVVRRIEACNKKEANKNNPALTNDGEDDEEFEETLFGVEEETVDPEKPKPEVGDYWTVHNGRDLLYVKIISANPVKGYYFEPSKKGKYLRLVDTCIQCSPCEPHYIANEDLGKKANPPKIHKAGSRQEFYSFEKECGI